VIIAEIMNRLWFIPTGMIIRDGHRRSMPRVCTGNVTLHSRGDNALMEAGAESFLAATKWEISSRISMQDN
jgi:hypothetical protein